ncbi:hypothetical protein [Streptomyces sp. CC224B]|uniref:hypothetical protein n=1 Tax=Streptomyces sp. CC224B TaxID=3044571 RepID=UPI0024A89136|nr:hypothetical protein [Streptomyces sp. CC224B]
MTTLYFLAGAASPVFAVACAIQDARERGFDMRLGLTPSAAERLADDLDEPATLTTTPNAPRRSGSWPSGPPSRAREVEGRPDAVNLVKDLVGRMPNPGGQLRALAQRCGLRA